MGKYVLDAGESGASSRLGADLDAPATAGLDDAMASKALILDCTPTATSGDIMDGDEKGMFNEHDGSETAALPEVVVVVDGERHRAQSGSTVRYAVRFVQKLFTRARDFSAARAFVAKALLVR